MRRYFIAYMWRKEALWGAGVAEFARNEPICNLGDLKLIMEELRAEDGLSYVTILSWRLFEDPEG